MATESPIMISSHKEQAFSSASRSVYSEEIRLARKGQSFPHNGKDSVPDRSGSAPPSIEGSYLAVNNLASHLNSSVPSGKLRNVAQNFDEKLSNAGNYALNSRKHRVPTPPIPKENRLPSAFYGGNWRLGSIDCNTNRSSLVQTSLSTHSEELEDDPSTNRPPIDLNDRLWSNDLIQDLPRSSSPMYNQLHSVSSITDEQADGELNTFDESSVNSSSHLDAIRQPFGSEASLIPVASTSLNYTVPSQHALRNGNSNSESMSSIESGMKNMDISSLLIPKDQGTTDQWHKNYLQQSHPHQSNLLQVHDLKSHVSGFPYMPLDNLFQGVPKLSSEPQPLLQSSGFTPPLYANYMTSPAPYYPSFQTSALYQQQYSLAGYHSSSGVVPSHFIGGFPLPLSYNGQTNPTFSGRGATPLTNVPIGSDVQSFNKGGYPPQTTFLDPFYMQYYQQPFGSVYGHPGQYEPLGIGNQNLYSESKKGSEFVSGSDDYKGQNQRPGFGYINNVRGGIVAPHYLGTPQNMGLVMPYPPSPLAVPIYFGNSPVISGSKDETRHAGVTNKYATVFSGWQGRRVAENYNDPRIFNFLEELKSGKGRRFELLDIAGYIVEFSTDQHGSRFIQQKLEICSPEEKATVFQEILPYAPKLMTDVFGNYVVQKFFEYGTPVQRKELANQLSGQILPLSLQMYGCRVIQKALDVIDIDQKAQLIVELEGHVLRCVRDQNGNHVIQKCIESVPAEKIEFIISAFRGQVATLSMHPYGCRVIQRVLEHCTDEFLFQFIVDEILESVYILSQDQYGNYVTQHVMERGKPEERLQIVGRLSGHIVQLSQHKFASNVIEKCLENGCFSGRNLIIDEVLCESEKNDNLLVMMKDQFANYVVQKILDTCTDGQRLSLLSRVRPHLHALKKYTYGKHIVGRFEQQFGEEESA